MWARQRAALAAGATARDLQREIKAALLSPYARATRPELAEVALAMADDIGAETLDAQLALQATRVDERPGLARIRCPTLIIAGRRRRPVPARAARGDARAGRRVGAGRCWSGAGTCRPWSSRPRRGPAPALALRASHVP